MSYSNACKFTPSGGKLSITTRLILPAVDTLRLSDEEKFEEILAGDAQRPLSADYLSQHNMQDESKAPLEWIVVRIEVSDTGYGIKAQDMSRSKLFCESLECASDVRIVGLMFVIWFSCIQSNGTRSPTRLIIIYFSYTTLFLISLSCRRERNRSRLSFGSANCQAERRPPGRPVESRRRIYFLGGITLRCWRQNFRFWTT